MATVLPVSAHCPGIVDGSEAYAAQSGIGTAAPMQTSSVSALESPGAPRAALYSAVGVGLWKSPTPPRRIVGPPSSPPPPVHMKPMRGERRVCSGIRSVRSAKSESTARLYGGAPLKRATSSRVPYVSCRPPVRQESARYTAPFHAVPPSTTGAKTREKLAGLSAARALSDGNTNVPSWFGVWFWSRPVPLNTPPPRSVRVPPVGGRPRGLTRVGCCESHRPSSRSVSVWASDAFQSNRRNATALSVVRSSERPWTCAGAPLAAASARNREAESGLTPSRVKVRGSAEASDGSACPRQRPCSAPNTNSLFRTIGPPIPPLSWFWVYPCPNGDVVTCPQASERSRSV